MKTLTEQSNSSTQPNTHSSLRMFIYGIEGVGKSSFAAQASSPIFLCTDVHAALFETARFQIPNTWDDILEAISSLTNDPHEYQTLVIDTVDGIESLAWLKVCSTHGVSQIEEIPYRKGYTFAVDLWREFFEVLENLKRTRNMHIIILGGATLRREECSEDEGQVHRFTTRIHDQAFELVRVWADAIFFAGYHSIKSTPIFMHTKVHTSIRLLYTEGNHAFYAHNRWALQFAIPLSWAEFNNAVQVSQKNNLQLLRAQIESMLPIVPDRKRAEQAYYEWAQDDPMRLQQLLKRMRERLRKEPLMPIAESLV